MGPLTSPEHRDRVLSYVKVAEDEGGEVLLGGTAPDDPALAAGCYVLPTVVRGRPVGAGVPGGGVRPVRHRVDASPTTTRRSAIANGTDYGLGGGLWTRDLARAHRMAARLPRRDGVDQLLQAGRTPARRSAASGSPATAARWASRPCATTPSPSRCGSTSTPTSRPGTRGADVARLTTLAEAVAELRARRRHRRPRGLHPPHPVRRGPRDHPPGPHATSRSSG